MTVVFQSDYSITLRGMLANYIEGEKGTHISLHLGDSFFFSNFVTYGIFSFQRMYDFRVPQIKKSFKCLYQIHVPSP